MATVNALTVDVEDYFHVSAFADNLNPEDWDALPARVEGNTQHLLRLFDGAGVKATFFVLGWVAQRYPDLVREIHARGHEVACHGMSHQLIYTQSPAVFADETRRSKELLEDLISAPVAGYRGASYSITQRSLWALDILVEAGFRYDSSIVATRHDLYGIPGAEPTPHELTTPSGARIIEFPPTTYPVLGREIPIGGGGYFRLYPYWLTRSLLERTNLRRNSPFIFYLHPWEIDPDQPRIPTKFRSRFRHYLNLKKTERRLRRLLVDFEFATVSDVLRDLGPLPHSAAPAEAPVVR